MLCSVSPDRLASGSFPSWGEIVNPSDSINPLDAHHVSAVSCCEVPILLRRETVG